MFTKQVFASAFSCLLTLPALADIGSTAAMDASSADTAPHGSEECYHSGALYNPNVGWNNRSYYSAGCNYNDSYFNNGWGWNPYTGTSCPPLQGGCDYSNADFNNGWGWDAGTGTSCPPL